MVLTERTAKGAAITAHGQNHAARIKVNKRLLFNRIESGAADFSIVAGDDLTVLIDPSFAEANLSFIQIALTKADLTLHDESPQSAHSCSLAHLLSDRLSAWQSKLVVQRCQRHQDVEAEGRVFHFWKQ